MAIRWNNIRAELFQLRAKVREMSAAIQQRDDIISARDNHIAESAQEIHMLRHRFQYASDEVLRAGGRIAALEDKNCEMRYDAIKNAEYLETAMREKSEIQAALIDEAKRSANLHIDLDKARSANRHLISRMKDGRELLVKFARYVNKLTDENNILRYTIEETNKCLDFRKGEIASLKSRMENDARTMEGLELAIEYYTDENRQVFAENEELQNAVTVQAAEITRLRNELHSMTESAIENEVCGIVDFEQTPGVLGFAPCGNGCEIKRDEHGRQYEEHNDMCEESPDFNPASL